METNQINRISENIVGKNIKEIIKGVSKKQINRISKIIKGVSENISRISKNISRISENVKCIYLE